MTTHAFGISTHLYHRLRLGREQLLEIAAHGFDRVEVYATRTHLDYHNPTAIAEFQQGLAEAGLTLHAIHAPTVDGLVGSTWGASFSNATLDASLRELTIRETEAALSIARRIPTKYLVVHLGQPKVQRPAPGDNNRDAARRSIEDLQRLAAPLGVQLALEVIPNDLSAAGSLVHLIEEELELDDLGICLDFGHAHLQGDVLDAVEACSGHLVTTHVHDNLGRIDDHLMPFDGTIDWPAALQGVQKIGYDGAFVFELASHTTPKEVLRRAQQVRRRFEDILGEE